MAKILSREDLLSFTMGGMALSTGGGGTRPLDEDVEKMVDKALARGKEFKLISLDEIPDDSIIFTQLGTGGGITVEQRLRWMNSPGCFAGSGGPLRTGFDRTSFIQDQIRLKDKTFAPLNSWSQLPGPKWADAASERLKQLIGKQEIFSYLISEINQMLIRTLVDYANKGWPIIDSAACGHRAVPECTISTLNIHDVQVCPAVITTFWGDLLVLEKTLNWQRTEEILDGISTYSGGNAGGPMAIEGNVVKKAAIPGAVSFTIKIGKAIRKALQAGDDPIQAMINAADGLAYKAFEGEITAILLEQKYGFIWGYSLLKGTGDWNGHHLKIWFKNENHVSWLDEEPYITSPDGLNVIDPETGWGLANFWPAEWEHGRKVVVVGVRAEDIWRTEKGLKLLGPKHFDVDIAYKPIEKVLG